MNSTAVDSAALTNIAYDDSLQVLRLEFQSRAVYEYAGVPPGVYQALLEAPSKGGYFNRAIRGYFPYSLVSRDQADEPPPALRATR